MRRTLLVALMLMTVGLAGCIGEDTADTGSDSYDVQWTQAPQDIDQGEEIEVEWRLTGPEGSLAATAVVHGQESVASPEDPSEYANSSGQEKEPEVPGDYSTTLSFEESGTYYVRAYGAQADGTFVWTEEVEIEVTPDEPVEPPLIVEITDQTDQAPPGGNVTVNWSLSGLPGENVTVTGFHYGSQSAPAPNSTAAYNHSSGLTENASVPGDHSTTFGVDEPGVYHGRAHALYQGDHHWSVEITFNVTANGTGNGTDNGTDDNGTLPPGTVLIHDEGPTGTGVSYEPANLTVQPGDNVTWINRGNTTHGIDFQDDSLEDPGTAEPGETINWTVPEDLAPGTYEYTESEPIQGLTSPTGKITVEAPG